MNKTNTTIRPDAPSSAYRMVTPEQSAACAAALRYALARQEAERKTGWADLLEGELEFAKAKSAHSVAKKNYTSALEIFNEAERTYAIARREYLPASS